ncbi:MAG: sulfatase-like hydrolase/transferase [Gemmataceae bacterium]|nr:sulfatase-like hydrolase/transferase [Gemmataceae bacterium]
MRVLVLNAEALNLAYLGCYGNEWVNTPTLDRLAAEGVVFDRHFGDSPGAPRTAWTGRYAFPAPPDAPPARPGPDLPTLLQAEEVPFALVNEANAAGEPAEEATPLERVLVGALRAVEGLEAAERWLVWADLPGLLPPWDVPRTFLDHYFTDEPSARSDPEDEELEPLTPLSAPAVGPIDIEDITLLERLHFTYAAMVTYLDSGLALLFEELGRRGLLENTTVLFTASRGLPMGEHGIFGAYRPWPHDEVLHLPLVLRLPGAAEAGLHVPALTQPVDLLPTVLALLRLPVPEGLHGHSLLPLVRAEKEKVRDYAVAGVELGEALEWALRTPEWGLILPERVPAGDAPRGPQLYAKPDDRWEVNNVVQHHLDLAEALAKVVRGFVEATRAAGPLVPPPLPEEEEGPTGEDGVEGEERQQERVEQ